MERGIPCYKETAAIDTVAITPARVGSSVVNVALEIEDSVDFSLYFSLFVSERSSLVTGSSARLACFLRTDSLSRFSPLQVCSILLELSF